MYAKILQMKRKEPSSGALILAVGFNANFFQSNSILEAVRVKEGKCNKKNVVGLDVSVDFCFFLLVK